MTEATETAEKPQSPVVLAEGQTSLVLDGQEVVFQPDQMELPGMPDATRLRRLAGGYVAQARRVAEERDRLQKVNQEIMLELRNEGRSGFAYREGGSTFTFMIDAPAEQLVVKKKNR